MNESYRENVELQIPASMQNRNWTATYMQEHSEERSDERGHVLEVDGLSPCDRLVVRPLRLLLRGDVVDLTMKTPEQLLPSTNQRQKMKPSVKKAK